MALARVVTFEGVDRARIDQLREQIETGEQPEGLNATEIIVLHDGGADKVPHGRVLRQRRRLRPRQRDPGFDAA